MQVTYSQQKKACHLPGGLTINISLTAHDVVRTIVCFFWWISTAYVMSWLPDYGRQLSGTYCGADLLTMSHNTEKVQDKKVYF
jgi:hypothetical protein